MLQVLPRAPEMAGEGMNRRRIEDQIQRAVFEHFAVRAAPGVVAFHPANGGWRSKVEAAVLKGLGVVAGAPDIIACKDGKFYALEIKAPGGRLSDAQERMLIRLREAGAHACHAH